MPACLATLSDDDVHACIGVLARLRRRATQRGDLTALIVDVFDHLGRRRAEGVGDQGHFRMPQRDLDLRGGGRFGPAEELKRIGAAALDRHAVVGQDLAGEVHVLLRHHVLQGLGQFVGAYW